MPAVILVLAACLGAVQLVGKQVRLEDAASQAARAFARDDTSAPPADVAGATLARSTRDGLVCATVAAPGRALGAIEVPLSATSCALGGGL